MANVMTNENPQGFYFDQKACIGCRTCQIACKDKNKLKVGYLLRKVASYEVGEFPTAAKFHYSGACNHCHKPACVAACPTGATYIDAEDGTVQHDSDKCIGCLACKMACPYGHPILNDDTGIVDRCDGCITLRNAGEKPSCVASCPMRALDFGPIAELRAAHPDAVDQISVLPDAAITGPSVVIDARAAAFDGAPRELIV